MGTAAILPQVRVGEFGAGQSRQLTLRSGRKPVTLADLNGDGRLDVVVAARGAAGVWTTFRRGLSAAVVRLPAERVLSPLLDEAKMPSSPHACRREFGATWATILASIPGNWPQCGCFTAAAAPSSTTSVRLRSPRRPPESAHPAYRLALWADACRSRTPGEADRPGSGQACPGIARR